MTGYMDEYECTCTVVRGEREIAYGEDCYSYYPKPNYGERIVRCRDCRYSLDGGTLCSYRKPFYFQVLANGFCNNGVRRRDG